MICNHAQKIKAIFHIWIGMSLSRSSVVWVFEGAKKKELAFLEELEVRSEALELRLWRWSYCQHLRRVCVCVCG